MRIGFCAMIADITALFTTMKQKQLPHFAKALSDGTLMRKAGEVGMIEEYIEKHESTDHGDYIGYVQPLVRCKNCKYWNVLDTKSGTNTQYEAGTGSCGCYRGIHDGNWFCADGKRWQSKKKYAVTVIEKLSRLIEIEAESEEEAKGKAQKMWSDGEILLGDRDFEGMECEVTSMIPVYP